MAAEYDFPSVSAQFCTGGTFVSCVRYGEGHINDTFKLTVNDNGIEKHYILQRINNRLFADVDKLMHNIELVTDFCRKSVEKRGGDPLRECLMLVRTKDGKSFYFDGENYFRMYVFIENATSYQVVRDPADFYESARAFGGFASLLADFDASQLYEILPDFHNTKVRYANFLRAMEKDVCGRKNEVQKEVDWVISHKDLCGKIVDKIASGEIPLRVTHNDTKLNNVMLDDATGKALAVIDLDTVMPGSLCYDFGDSIRFGCNPAAEDEPDLSKVNFRFDLYETYLDGYLSAVGGSVTEEEKKNLPVGAVLMTYECGMRFLTDYLEGDVYFKTHRPKQNLDRARTQFKLVDDMLSAFGKMTDAAMKR
ncbi:MAG TPA: aminoglycoside phosphotransferase family protein [Candidatus Borkfalkia stercoripullorum]|nr:aminoglycoside phosphotransferase family protein [Candidatus Borkfalkia stercoripullorum]